MSEIIFDLHQSASLAGMAPTPDGAGGFSDAVMPGGLEGSGIYVIYNKNTENRYIGISTELSNRFNSRMSVVTELGFANAEMANIFVIWGEIGVRNTGGNLDGLPDYMGPLTTTIDGTVFNLEHLLIRFFLLVAGFGGTISNNIYVNTPFKNTTLNPLSVQVIWGGDEFDIDDRTSVLAPGAQW